MAISRYRAESRALRESLGGLLLNISRTGALLVDGDLHEAALRAGRNDTPEYAKLRDTLKRIQDVNQLRDSVYTLSHVDGAMARFAVISTGHVPPGTPYRLAPEIRRALARTIAEGSSSYTDIYVDDNGTWTTAFAPVRNAAGQTVAALDVDFRADVYLGQLAAVRLESPEGLRFGGEKREVTILMSDLRGYTRFAEQGDPAWVMEVLNGYLARMAEIIIGYGGTINEFIGDAIFAVFGAPLPHRDHAERAAAAALAMQRAMEELNHANVARGRPPFEMGIGINTGEAVVGNIGSEQRAKYAVVGGAVNVASRVEGVTVGGQIFLSATSYDRIREIADVGAPVPVALKGLAEPLVLYELRALAGRFAQRLPEERTGSDRQVEVSLPLECWVIDGKAVRAESLRGTARRLGPREVEAELSAALPALTNVKLRIDYQGPGHVSGDLYGKVIGEDHPGGEHLTRIRLTSVDEADLKALEAFLGE